MFIKAWHQFRQESVSLLDFFPCCEGDADTLETGRNCNILSSQQQRKWKTSMSNKRRLNQFEKIIFSPAVTKFRIKSVQALTFYLPFRQQRYNPPVHFHKKLRWINHHVHLFNIFLYNPNLWNPYHFIQIKPEKATFFRRNLSVWCTIRNISTSPSLPTLGMQRLSEVTSRSLFSCGGFTGVSHCCKSMDDLSEIRLRRWIITLIGRYPGNF